MQVESVPLTPENLWMCVPLWGGGETYAGQEMQAVLDGASRLLSERRAVGAIVLENERVRAFGVTTFADEAVVDGYLADPQPHLGKRLLVDAQAPESTSVLPVSGIAERNAGAGLQVVVANTACDTGARDGATVLGVLMRAFHDIHRGYRIGRIVIEVFGENAISALMRSGSFEVLRIFNVPAASRQLRSLVGTLTREQAVASTLPLLAMFAYSPPRLFFTTAEQELLSEALAGVTDGTLSRRLQIPLSAVKARWTRVQERAVRRAPDLFKDVPVPPCGGRGVQRRHLILQYVRHHPSELTPYAQTPARQRPHPAASATRPSGSGSAPASGASPPAAASRVASRAPEEGVPVSHRPPT
jgi:hypothetical protein